MAESKLENLWSNPFVLYKHNKSPWITNGILKSIIFRDKLYKIIKLTPLNHPSYSIKKPNLSTYNKTLKQSIKIAKQHYYFKCFDKYKNDIKNTRKTISGIMCKSKPNTYPDFFIENGRKLYAK